MERATFTVALCALILSGCAPKELALPVTELPRKPYAAEAECHELSEMEEQACLQEGAEARAVCAKVQRNKAICEGNQTWIGRLYEERQGK